MKLEDVPNGSAAFVKIPFIDWLQILIFVGLTDVFSFQTESRVYLGDYESFGTFGFLSDRSIEDQELTDFEV